MKLNPYRFHNVGKEGRPPHINWLYTQYQDPIVDCINTALVPKELLAVVQIGQPLRNISTLYSCDHRDYLRRVQNSITTYDWHTLQYRIFGIHECDAVEGWISNYLRKEIDAGKHSAVECMRIRRTLGFLAPLIIHPNDVSHIRIMSRRCPSTAF